VDWKTFADVTSGFGYQGTSSSRPHGKWPAVPEDDDDDYDEGGDDQDEDEDAEDDEDDDDY
jgi:hypothetical protein